MRQTVTGERTGNGEECCNVSSLLTCSGREPCFKEWEGRLLYEKALECLGIVEEHGYRKLFADAVKYSASLYGHLTLIASAVYLANNLRGVNTCSPSDVFLNPAACLVPAWRFYVASVAGISLSYSLLQFLRRRANAVEAAFCRHVRSHSYSYIVLEHEEAGPGLSHAEYIELFNKARLSDPSLLCLQGGRQYSSSPCIDCAKKLGSKVSSLLRPVTLPLRRILFGRMVLENALRLQDIGVIHPDIGRIISVQNIDEMQDIDNLEDRENGRRSEDEKGVDFNTYMRRLYRDIQDAVHSVSVMTQGGIILFVNPDLPGPVGFIAGRVARQPRSLGRRKPFYVARWGATCADYLLRLGAGPEDVKSRYVVYLAVGTLMENNAFRPIYISEKSGPTIIVKAGSGRDPLSQSLKAAMSEDHVRRVLGKASSAGAQGTGKKLKLLVILQATGQPSQIGGDDVAFLAKRCGLGGDTAYVWIRVVKEAASEYPILRGEEHREAGYLLGQALGVALGKLGGAEPSCLVLMMPILTAVATGYYTALLRFGHLCHYSLSRQRYLCAKLPWS